MTAGRIGGFAVSTEFVGSKVVVAVLGQVDLFTAGDLGAILSSVMDQGHRRVVLDLSDCSFMDASGLGIVAAAAERLDLWGGRRLTIRSPSSVVRRALHLTGLAQLTDLEPDDTVVVGGGADGSLLAAGRAVIPIPVDASAALAQHLRRVLVDPAGDDVVDVAVRLVVALAQVTVAGADGVSVSLRRSGRLSTVAASDQTILEMDAEQYAAGEGPCVDASVEGRWFHATSLLNETRWPAFTRQALGLGIRSILSSPLVVRDRPVGALNMYSRTPAAFAGDDQRLASLFAAEASTVLAGAGADVTADQIGGRLTEALEARKVIALAQGVLMERDSIDENAAFTALRRSSVRSGNPLSERAADVVASARRPGGGQTA